MDHIVLQATHGIIVRGYAQYNKGERAVFSVEQAASLLDEYPEGFVEVRQEDANLVKALTAPPVDKMRRAPERKK